MPFEIANQAFTLGLDSVPLLKPTVKAAPFIAALVLVKRYFGGARNISARDMHGKVVIITGGTSGVGEAVLKDLATRGAQIVLLTQHALGDPFLVDFIDDTRAETNNQLITAEQVDLSSLHSVRQFATKWIDNAPPRRLDMIVLCANTIGAVAGAEKHNEVAGEGVELLWQVNYLANFHLLSILSPAIRAQPPDRDVRILFGGCSSYLGGDLLHITQASSETSNTKKTTASNGKPPSRSSQLTEPTRISPANAYPTSKLALTTFAIAFQKHLNAYKRPDNFPNNTKIIVVDPGICRTPGTRRWLSWGSLIGLLLYLLLYPLWWLVLKPPQQGAQSFMFAAMDERFARMRQDLGEELKDGDQGGWYIKECKSRPFGREDVQDEAVQKKLWEASEKMIEEAEKKGKVWRSDVKRRADDAKEVEEAEREMKDYKAKIGKSEGQKKEGSRRSKKAG